MTHIGIECHLGLIADAGCNLVCTKIVGYIVLDVEHGVLNLVPVGEELGTEVHIRRTCIAEVTCSDFHEGEESAVVATHILNVGIGDEQLVGKIVGKAAVEIDRISGNLVHHVVERVAEHETVLAGHIIAQGRHITRGGRLSPCI